MAVMPAYASVAALAMLATAGILGLAAITVVVMTVLGHLRVMRRTLPPVLGVLVVYGGTLATASMMSRERVLGADEFKVICELDCHLTYSLTAVEVLSPAQAEALELRAPVNGAWWAVTVRTWFDPSTISDRRPTQLPVTPGPRLVYLSDASGQRWMADAPVAIQLGEFTPITRELRPGEAYETRFVFDAPASMEGPRLMLTDDFAGVRLMIGHERSFFHRDIWFAVTPPAPNRAG